MDSSTIGLPHEPQSVPTIPAGRPLARRALHWVRRLHLYMGLLLLPWAVLYGVTAFLLNHPLVLSDQPVEAFDQAAWSGTPMAELRPLVAVARDVVEALNKRKSESSQPVELIETEPVKYSRDLAFVTVKSAPVDYGLAVDPLGVGGTKRLNPPAAPEPEPFPYAVGSARPASSGKKGIPAAVAPENPLTITGTLAEHLKSSLPMVIQKMGWQSGEVTITSVPDLVFVVRVQERLWRVSFNSLTGSLTGKPFETPVEPLSWRRFLVRMHLSHGYPLSSSGSRWVWAIVVDVMAFVMIYWGSSGLLMWWQIKSTRRLGLGLLALSAVAATLLAVGMHGVIRGG